MDVADIRRVLPEGGGLDPDGELEMLPPFGPVGVALAIDDLRRSGFTVLAERCDHPPFTHLVRMKLDPGSCPEPETIWYLARFR